ncbi:DUF1707 SHOCT-like domain-containing protein [Micromonosporaceae bacterium Da 78-11]
MSVRDDRIGHAERAEVVGMLGWSLDQGHLPLVEHDLRVAAVGTATYAWELSDQLRDLPVSDGWRPIFADEPPPGRPPSPGAARAALILGIVSLPLSFCVIGGVLGVLAVVASVRAGRPLPGDRRIGSALIGRILGIIGIALSVAALAAIIYLRNHQLGA